MQKSQRLFAAAFLFYCISASSQVSDSLIIKAAPQFSGQVAIIKNDSLVFSFAKGWMNFPMQIPMNKELLLEIGELSSYITREAIYDLIKNKKLDNDSMVSKYIPLFPYKNITIQHLLNQSSGLPSNYLKLYHRYIYDDESIKLRDKAKGISNADIIHILNKYEPALEFNPGEKSVQCNTNDIVLAYIIETMYFKSYEETINEMLIHKYKNLNIIANNDIEYTPLPLRASGHRKESANLLSIEESLMNFGFKYSDATMGHHHLFASAESLSKYFSTVVAPLEKNGTSYAGHEPGYNSLVYFNKGICIVILSNTSDEVDSQLILKALLSQF
ncbi:MAG: serine hydrolase [Bacteroidetes bacterium]|nr:serine hydrolase [Bacteroidota bacterium]